VTTGLVLKSFGLIPEKIRIGIKFYLWAGAAQPTLLRRLSIANCKKGAGRGAGAASILHNRRGDFPEDARLWPGLIPD
jgi:hypothetical protein